MRGRVVEAHGLDRPALQLHHGAVAEEGSRLPAELRLAALEQLEALERARRGRRQLVRDAVELGVAEAVGVEVRAASKSGRRAAATLTFIALPGPTARVAIPPSPSRTFQPSG